MRYPNTSALVACLSLLLVCGCEHYNAINFVTNTEFGVKVGVNAEKIPEVKIGYSRQEAARVPVYLMGGAVASRTPGEVNSLLNQADERLRSAADNVANPGNQKDNILTAKQLIEAAVQADHDAGTGRYNSPILAQIKEAADKLPSDGTTSATKQNIDYVRGMIAAERERPVFHTEFQEAGKFIGTKNDKDANDAYSVIGTFKGNAGGGAGDQADANMGIAQYFATGIAAQLLAETGGAALVSTGPNAASPVARAVIQARIEENMSNLQRVAKWIARGGDTPTKKNRFTTALMGVLGDNGASAFKGLPSTDEAAISHYLEKNFSTSERAMKQIEANTKGHVNFE